MNRNHANLSEKQVWQRSFRALANWGLGSILALLIAAGLAFDLTLSGAWRWTGMWVLALASGLLAWWWERCLAGTSVPKRWRYRLAFAASVGLPALYWLAQWPLGRLAWGGDPSRAMTPLDLGILALGAFAGAFIASGLNEGFYENNSPPSEAAEREVRQRHIAVIGTPGPIPRAKRAFDLILASFGSIVSMPFWSLSLLIIWFEDPGPVLFVKNSVGKGGVNFHQFKLRTMYIGAESNTGPVISQLDDRRVLRFGKFLRKTALDELPQLLNILAGQMSFVGPRPQRTVLVQGYLEDMPEYAWRHMVLPGLAGLAQVAGDYYLTPRQKLRFDRLYIRYSGLGYDLKLITLACMITFWYRWQKDWNGRLPRALIRWGS